MWIRTVLSPLMFVGRTFNTAANVYLAGKIGAKVYKNVRTMQKEKLRAEELKARFIAEYAKRNDGQEPSDELVSLTLKSYDAVENPIQHRIKSLFG
tara:strand:+ start:7849 stop:8136 length:288 start_codon:yes stop_codon:yes gene_type:complete